MSKIIAIALQKGGVGKTTTVVNVATILAEKKKKVLVVDFDSQGNATMSLGVDPDEQEITVLELLLDRVNYSQAIVKTEYGVDLIPANTFLSGLVVTILNKPEIFTSPMTILKEKLEYYRDKYDYILIDLPPELGFYTINGLAAADEVLIPLQCEARAVKGVDILIDAVNNTKKSYNPRLKIMGIVGTMFNRNTNISTTVLQQARKVLEGKIKVYDTVIYRTVKFSEADLYNQPAVVYSPHEHIQSYRDFVKEAFNVG